MQRIELEIKVLSPLAIARQKPGGSISEAVGYIPGTVIRGAVAAQILDLSNGRSTDLTQNGGDFQALFLSENPAIFQNAYPALIINGKLIPKDRFEENGVLPATALSSKNKPGFKRKDKDPEKNGVFDTLIDRFCAEGYGYPYDPNCPEDGGRVDAAGISFYCKFNKKYHSLTVNKRLLTRVGINRRRATSEEEILYSLEVLNESQETKQNPVYYRGAILVEDDLAETLRDFIQDRHQNFRLGGSTSRGLGKVEIQTKNPVDAKIDVSDRIDEFNQRLKERWDKWVVFGSPIKESPTKLTYFTLDLQSDAILTENWRRTTVISEKMLHQFAGVEAQDKSLRLEAAYSSYDFLSGWNAGWGLMKDVELITTKGAVYLFSTTQPEVWIQRLGELEMRGLGDRTCEGFGQIQICNQFHNIFREEAV
ncbi:MULTISPECIES: CRISPR-associated RAMP protein Csx10 [unclassified Microcoleus]|uniref:type III-D CRISPR-associated RAMP protein Csx10 n=1 Tax=unclassified Microcoleus TaxID=2642155 RepID=UPI001DC77B8D|nr:MULTISPECIES: CRISPR-associated RAMP protein Csx10 [unclassified Microcoleus]TAE16884.1 MAG: CRISPR-associated RAMP protein Csx10 [Oscillatoriales cyanobacterium]MCC3413196.1 CRISPR-associated RAMP protein Csx10 [Microcoleus sp. PH2017_02_FOX_O_A]MCC3514656.1 CRISPR-associated RAMP protein Csx10 [Microcoleus sp. PH2017_18_LLB_O_A]MCC3532687.1 CRISPR-associated RAMP protein Csx10 [Microcoleus sp. PH2017_25_DOB_D_A]MCC3545086.1 CRISPR-associated RAMP protein Csx10 [Microcoleus sp. PH2017_24_D